MSLKVFVTVAAVWIAYCNASTLPEIAEASKTVPKPQDPTTLPEPLPTVNQVEGTNVQQSGDKPEGIIYTRAQGHYFQQMFSHR